MLFSGKDGNGNHELKRSNPDMEVSNFHAGIVVRIKDRVVVREGVIYDPETETLLGGWAEVVNGRKRRYATVSFQECDRYGVDSSRIALHLRNLALQRAAEELSIGTCEELLTYIRRNA